MDRGSFAITKVPVAGQECESEERRVPAGGVCVCLM